MNGDFRIGIWLVQPGLNTISQNGTTRQLEPKVMEVLLCLAHHAGETLAKEQLLKTIWPDTFVSDDVVIRSISEIRRAFDDDPRESKFIQTIPKRGYRLVPSVEVVKQDANGAEDSSNLPDMAKDSMGWTRATRIAVRLGGIAVVLLLVSLVAGPIWRRFFIGESSPQIRSIAVLPVSSLSSDPTQAYFADGVTDALITDLAQISALKVVSRTTAMRYKGTDKSLPQIARELNVDGIVEGTVQLSGDRMRISAQLIYGPADRHLWAKSFERDLKDMLQLQSTVASEIAHEIQVTLTPAERARLQNRMQVNAKALDAYLQARLHIDRVSRFQFDKGKEVEKAELQKAFSYLDQAIEQDSAYRPAYLAYFEAIDDADPPSPFEYLPKAKSGLMKALQLGEEDMEGHLAMAKLFMRYEYDWVGAEREYKRSIEVNPSSGYAHFSYSEYLANVGRTAEADRELKLAQSLSPAHDYFNDHFAVLQRTDRTLEQQRQALEESTFNNPFVLMIMAKNYGIAGRFKESVEMWERCLTLYGRPDFAGVLRQAEATGGPRFALEEWMRAVEEYSNQHDDLHVGMAAFTYSSLGNKDRAFAWLDKAVEQRDWCIPFLRRDNVWNPLRSDPRFQSLLRRVGLPP
jgi:TolB-like protein/DNA-binding winged helix-turn-helix (wHTH) protein